MHDAGKYEEALASYRRALDLDPACVDAYYEMAVTYHAGKDYDRALSLCRRALRIPGADTCSVLPHLYSLFGSAYDDKGDFKKALSAYDKGLARCRGRHAAGLWPLYFNKGVALYRADRTAEAEEAFSAAADNNPLYPSAHFQLGNVRYAHGDRVGCLPSYFFFLLLSPKGERAEQVCDRLEEIVGSYVEKTDEGVTLTPGSTASDMRLGLFLAAGLSDSLSPFPEPLRRIGALYGSFLKLYALEGRGAKGELMVRLPAVYREKVLPLLAALDGFGCSGTALCYMTSGVCPEAEEWLKGRPWEVYRLAEAVKEEFLEKEDR